MPNNFDTTIARDIHAASTGKSWDWAWQHQENDPNTPESYVVIDTTNHMTDKSYHHNERCLPIKRIALTHSHRHGVKDAKFIAAAHDGPHSIIATCDCIDELREALKGLLDNAVIISRDYLDTFNAMSPDATICGFSKAQWLDAADAADIAHAVLADTPAEPREGEG